MGWEHTFHGDGEAHGNGELPPFGCGICHHPLRVLQGQKDARQVRLAGRIQLRSSSESELPGLTLLTRTSALGTPSQFNLFCV